MIPAGLRSIELQSTAMSSDLRNAPAKPIKSSARSRISLAELPRRRRDGDKVLFRKCCHTLLWTAVGPSNAPKSYSHEIVCGRVGICLQRVSTADRGKPAREGGDRQAPGMIRQISRDGLRDRRHAPTPGDKMVEITGVGTICIRGDRCSKELANFRIELLGASRVVVGVGRRRR